MQCISGKPQFEPSVHSCFGLQGHCNVTYTVTPKIATNLTLLLVVPRKPTILSHLHIKLQKKTTKKQYFGVEDRRDGDAET